MNKEELKASVRKRLEGTNLLNIALELHMINNGSSEGPSDIQTRQEIRQIIKDALECWEEGAKIDAPFDYAVKHLLTIVLYERSWLDYLVSKDE